MSARITARVEAALAALEPRTDEAAWQKLAPLADHWRELIQFFGEDHPFATLCLPALVREAWGVSRDVWRVDTSGPWSRPDGEPQWECEVWVRDYSSKPEWDEAGPRLSFREATLGEALIAALEAVASVAEPADQPTQSKVYLFEVPRFAWADEGRGVTTDDEGGLVDESGNEVSIGEAIAHGAMVKYWSTETAFATREHAEEWGRAKSYNYTDGWRVREVPLHTGGDRMPHPGRTHEALRRECTRDPIFLGQKRVPVKGAQDETFEWQTLEVFTTRSDGEDWHGEGSTMRIYCVPAGWDMETVLAEMTVGGRCS